MTDTLTVLDDGHRIEISLTEIMKYHGPGFPGDVAHAFKVMQHALPLLDPDGPPERREIACETAFRGPGARDAFEFVTRAVTDGRYLVDATLERAERGATLARYVFVLRYRERIVTLVIREGYVTDEFIELGRRDRRTPDEDRHLAVLKQEMADRLMAAPATEVYDLDSRAAG